MLRLYDLPPLLRGEPDVFALGAGRRRFAVAADFGQGCVALGLRHGRPCPFSRANRFWRIVGAGARIRRGKWDIPAAEFHQTRFPLTESPVALSVEVADDFDVPGGVRTKVVERRW